METRKVVSRIVNMVALFLFAAACTPVAVPAPTAANPRAPAVAATAPAATPVPATSAAPAPTAAPASGGGGSATKYVLVPGKSEASYSIREQLAQLSFPSDAVGKTTAISGSITVKADGTIDSAASKFAVDVSSLKSDQAMRDGYVSRQILQTSQYPQVVFVPAHVDGLPATLPQSGNVAFKVTGNLTIRDVTKPVTWDVTGTVTSGDATGFATTTFTFEDFNLPQPRVPVVLSVVDKITLKVSIDLQPAGG
jgi:polyisoprenoid-binding protein YceI